MLNLAQPTYSSLPLYLDCYNYQVLLESLYSELCAAAAAAAAVSGETGCSGKVNDAERLSKPA